MIANHAPRRSGQSAVAPVSAGPVRVATFGDSTANFGPATHDATSVTGVFPPSGATPIAIAFEKTAFCHKYPRAWLVANGGVSGDTTSGMLARDSAAASGARKAIADVLALKPDVVILRGGSINDVQGLTAASPQSAIDAIFDRHARIVARLLTGGCAVIDEGVFGYSPPSGVQADIDFRRAALVQLNARFAGLAAQLPGKVWFLNPAGLLSDAAGAYLPGICNPADGVHLQAKGAVALAEAEASILTAIFGPSPAIRYPGDNLVTNALMDATGAQAYGTCATGFTFGVANGTRANAKVEMIDGRLWQTCEYTPTGAGFVSMAYVPFPVTTIGIVANDVFGAEIDYFVRALDGSARPVPTGLLARLDFYKSGAGRLVLEGQSFTYGPASMDKMEGKVVFQPVKVPEPSANLTTASVFMVQFATDEIKPFKLGVGAPRLVKL